MTLCVLDSDKLRHIRPTPDTIPHATVEMAPVGGRAYLTAVHTVVDGVLFCLYAETHPDPSVPAEVVTAVAEFNSNPARWLVLVGEALDAEADMLMEDLETLHTRRNDTMSTRERLLGASA